VEKIKFVILHTIGNFLILFALFGVVATFGPAIKSEVIFRLNNLRNVKYVVKGEEKAVPIAQKAFFGDYLGGNKVEVLSPVDTNFGLVIPRIAANAQVEENIDPANYEEYMTALQKGVAHAKGTAVPGQPGNIYLFAHSTDTFWNVGRYNAVFYLLKELQTGDEINLYYKGIRHKYSVLDKKIVEPSEVFYLTRQTPYEMLTLQTCWPPGTSLKRMLVFAKPVGN